MQSAKRHKQAGTFENFRKKPVWEVKNEHRKQREGVTWATTRERRCQGTGRTELVKI